jgi:hypothetical protein
VSGTLDVSTSGAGRALAAFFANTNLNGRGVYVRGGSGTNEAFAVQDYDAKDLLMVLGNGNVRIGREEEETSGRLDLLGEPDVELRFGSRGGGSSIKSERTGTGGVMIISTDRASGDPTERMRVDDRGNVGIGTDSPDSMLHVAGNIEADGRFECNSASTTGPCFVANGGDAAESFPARESGIAAAEIVAADPGRPEGVRRAGRPYDPSVLGPVSTRPGVLLSNPTEGVPVALAGRVPVKVTLESGPIAIGDFLATSTTPGRGMRAAEPWRGGVIGTALSAFDGGACARKDASCEGTVVVFDSSCAEV